MVPPRKQHPSSDQPRAKGRFVSKNSSEGNRAALPSIPSSIGNVLPSSSHPSASSLRDVGGTATSSLLPELPSTKGYSSQPVDEMAQEAQEDIEPPPMSLPAVNKKWDRRLRPRNDHGKVIPPSASQTADILARKFAEISLGAADSHDVESGSDGSTESNDSSDEDEDEDESSTDEAENEGDAISITEDDALEMANDVLRSDKLCQIEELNGARDAVKTLTKTRQVLAKYRAEHPDMKHVDAFSFSKLTWKHLDRLGVSNAKSPSGDLHRQINTAFHLKIRNVPLAEAFPPFWDILTQNTDFLTLFEATLDTVGERPEARARLLTDQVLLRVMIFLKQRLSLVPLLFLELILSALTDKQPVVIVHKDHATFLTGSVDYAVISSISKANELRKTQFESHIGKLIKESDLQNMLKLDSHLAAEFGDMNHFKFTIIEEKKKDYAGSKLEQWEPQVIGEGLAIIRRTGRKHVPWCISNGEDWLFGLLTDGVESCRLPILSLHEGSREADLEILFKLLIIWTAIPDREIKDIFFTPSGEIV